MCGILYKKENDKCVIDIESIFGITLVALAVGVVIVPMLMLKK